MTRADDAYESLMREGIPRGLSQSVYTGDGPTACMMRAERQRLLWALAHGTDDNELIHDPSEACVAVDDMTATHDASSVGFPVEQEAG